MEQDKEDWKNRILDSFQDMGKAEPSEELYQKILDKIENQSGAKIVSLRLIRQSRLIAAAVVLLILMNFVAVYRYLNSKESIAANLKNKVDTSDTNLSYDLNLYEE